MTSPKRSRTGRTTVIIGAILAAVALLAALGAVTLLILAYSNR